MDREEYMKLKSECFIDIAKSSTACARSLSKEFGEVFDRAYNLGKKHAREEVVTEDNQLRLQVATAAMQGLLSNPKRIRVHLNEYDYKEYSKESVNIADALIAEVSKKGGEE